MSADKALDHTVVLRVPFETARQAQIARDTLRPDPILKSRELDVGFEAEAGVLVCSFAGVSDRVLRVAISNVIDNIKTIVECMDEFDGRQNEVFGGAEEQAASAAP